eukprot:TRINITY_DN824_c0_g1_i2.p1 TRINITY_DN824_c0_g1~~TRINITY_DN824_c0_g1_i2.p1  ORF type:complete len:338 (+),score=65.34 TRINITY_DN824_c0_g1_i2:35-1048(+)
MADAAGATPQRAQLRPGAATYVPPSRRKDQLPTDEKQSPSPNGHNGHPRSHSRRRRNKPKPTADEKSQVVAASPLSPPATFSLGAKHTPNNRRSASSRGGNSPGNIKNRGRKANKPRNTESFEPSFASPDIRVVYGPSRDVYPRPVGVHDLIMAPELFCKEEDMTMYQTLLAELQAAGTDSLFVSWHGDTHVIADDKKMGGKWKAMSPTFQSVVRRMEQYFNMDIKATRFNWYKDSKQWKPWHHDRAAFTPNCPQNATVAASFGACRDIAFLHAKQGTTVRVPQPNGSMYAFTRDANIDWKHGVMAEPESRQHDQGRISIIAWGWIDMLDWKDEMGL